MAIIRRSLFAFLIVATVFVDLAWAQRGFLLPLNPEIVYGTPRIMPKPDEERHRLFYFPSERNLHPSSLMAQGRPTYKEASALSVQNLLPNTGIFYGFDYFQEIDAIGREPYTQFLLSANAWELDKKIKLLRTFNVAYLVSFRPLDIAGLKLVKRFPEFLSWLYKIEDPIPRVYVVTQSVVETHPAQVLRRIAAPEFDPRRTVVLDQEAGIVSSHQTSATTNVIRYDHQKVIINATLTDAGILVLADAYYPGWKAYIDGTEQNILRANLFFRALTLTAGSHVVEFRYEPRSYAIGLSISLFTLAFLILFSLFRSLQTRQRRASLQVS